MRVVSEVLVSASFLDACLGCSGNSISDTPLSEQDFMRALFSRITLNTLGLLRRCSTAKSALCSLLAQIGEADRQLALHFPDKDIPSKLPGIRVNACSLVRICANFWGQIRERNQIFAYLPICHGIQSTFSEPK